MSRHESGGSSAGAASDTKEETGKRFKNIKYRNWTDAIQPPSKYRKPSDNELTQVTRADTRSQWAGGERVTEEGRVWSEWAARP